MKAILFILLAIVVLFTANQALAQKPDFSELEKKIEKYEPLPDGSGYQITLKPEYEDELKKNPIPIISMLFVWVVETKLKGLHGECLANAKGRVVTFKINLKETPPPRPPQRA